MTDVHLILRIRPRLLLQEYQLYLLNLINIQNTRWNKILTKMMIARIPTTFSLSVAAINLSHGESYDSEDSYHLVCSLWSSFDLDDNCEFVTILLDFFCSIKESCMGDCQSVSRAWHNNYRECVQNRSVFRLNNEEWNSMTNCIADSSYYWTSEEAMKQSHTGFLGLEDDASPTGHPPTATPAIEQTDRLEI